MFYEASNFNQILNKWEGDNYVIMCDSRLEGRSLFQKMDIYGMFEWASSYNQPLNTWNVSKVTNLESMFALAQLIVTVCPSGKSKWKSRHCKPIKSPSASPSNALRSFPSWRAICQLPTVLHLQHLFMSVKRKNQNVSRFFYLSYTTVSRSIVSVF